MIAVRSVLVVVIVALTVGLAHAQDAVRQSVVKILATQRLPDPFKPWSKQPPSEISGSGVVIDGKRILTNAHVVGFATQIYVQPYESADKLSAKVVATAPGVDLAILELEDAKFFDTHPALPMADELPAVKDKVNVYGYPMGGMELSVTEGIISRVEYAPMYYGESSLRIQIDAALNPGNSGGPAVSGGKIVGLAFSGIPSAEKIGYLIAVEEIKNFLVATAKGPYPGKLSVYGVAVQPTLNPALRKLLGLDDATTGVTVSNVVAQPAGFPIKRNDVITHIGPHAIDNEGNVRVRDDLRLRFGYYVPKLAADGKVEMTIFREGKSMKVQVPLATEGNRLVHVTRFEYPRYFIYGPLVFTPVTSGFTQSIPPGVQAALAQIDSPIVTRVADSPAFEGEELVAISSPMFPHRITKGYGPGALSVISHVNDTPVKSLAHLVQLLRDLKTDTVVFRCADRRETIVFNRQEADAATDEILTDNGIRYRYSDDLKEAWEGKGK